jgi:hypothetical protein
LLVVDDCLAKIFLHLIRIRNLQIDGASQGPEPIERLRGS